MGSGASNFLNQNSTKKNVHVQEVPSFKIVLVGDSNVGKSSIYLRYTREQFDYSYLPTMNVNIGNITKKVQQPFETLVSVTLWDLPGRGEIDLRRTYYKDTDAAMVVVDLCDEGSIEMAGTWKQDIMNNSFYTESGEKWHRKDIRSQLQLPILLVGNKMDKIVDDVETDELPKPIQRLEEIAVIHNFVGCVAVSACDSDGGVSAAFRSLVHYLLEKKMPKKTNSVISERVSLKDVFKDPSQHGKFTNDLFSIEDHSYQPLQLCKIEEFDDIFRACDKEVKSVERFCVSFLIAVRNFKRSCCVSGVTDSYKTSIEECVTSLKETLRDSADEEILLAHEEAGYMRLVISDEHKGEIPGPLKRVLEIYENEICKTTRSILSTCPMLHVSLSDFLNSLRTIEETATSKAVDMGFSKKQMKICLQHINSNISRIEDTIALSDESMKASDEQFKKIKSAMTW